MIHELTNTDKITAFFYIISLSNRSWLIKLKVNADFYLTSKRSQGRLFDINRSYFKD